MLDVAVIEDPVEPVEERREGDPAGRPEAGAITA
ncbi:hypothetical protein Aros01_03604 [Streptosporangium roseum]|uniref:Uncharacterized protein n=1 Tax=Streptosporangium roseum (strain ATCC 12428 / DSM 43021 / JCM 3005 / KCTC 9067 / NCIMB 10171 / NRRL 2505 / NI 9100) TaxID=479432 RepID=D2AWF6_STRRD|nr:hypothetical protein Sros_4044 [Streptosporangium roseum DSM 43021]